MLYILLFEIVFVFVLVKRKVSCYWDENTLEYSRVARVTLSIKQHAYGFLDRFPASLACGRASGLGTQTKMVF